MGDVTAIGYADDAHVDLSQYDNLQVQSALHAGAADIDSALAAAGLATPVSFAALAAGDARSRLQERFARVNIALALGYLTSGTTATSAKLTKDREMAEAWLARVRTGEEHVPLVARVSLRRRRRVR